MESHSIWALIFGAFFERAVPFLSRRIGNRRW